MGDMHAALLMTREHFESSCNRTPQYLSWHKYFEREFTKFLKERGCVEIQIGKPNHFDMSGFFKKGEQWWYFSIGDVRWYKDTMLIRTAKGPKDYTGGSNGEISLMGFGSEFAAEFDRRVISIIDEKGW